MALVRITTLNLRSTPTRITGNVAGLLIGIDNARYHKSNFWHQTGHSTVWGLLTHVVSVDGIYQEQSALGQASQNGTYRPRVAFSDNPVSPE